MGRVSWNSSWPSPPLPSWDGRCSRGGHAGASRLSSPPMGIRRGTGVAFLTAAFSCALERRCGVPQLSCGGTPTPLATREGRAAQRTSRRTKNQNRLARRGPPHPKLREGGGWTEPGVGFYTYFRHCTPVSPCADRRASKGGRRRPAARPLLNPTGLLVAQGCRWQLARRRFPPPTTRAVCPRDALRTPHGPPPPQASADALRQPPLPPWTGGAGASSFVWRGWVHAAWLATSWCTARHAQGGGSRVHVPLGESGGRWGVVVLARARPPAGGPPPCWIVRDGVLFRAPPSGCRRHCC